MQNKKPGFDLWVALGALVGLGLAAGVYLFVRFVIFGNPVTTGNITQGDIISATATVLGGFGIGALAVMQYRRHMWEKNQAKLDEDTRTGERLSKAIEHLGTGDEEKDNPVVIGALYEFKRLAKDSHRDNEYIVQILTLFIQRKVDKLGDKHCKSQEVCVAADILQGLCREAIESVIPIRIVIADRILIPGVLTKSRKNMGNSAAATQTANAETSKKGFPGKQEARFTCFKCFTSFFRFSAKAEQRQCSVTDSLPRFLVRLKL